MTSIGLNNVSPSFKGNNDNKSHTGAWLTGGAIIGAIIGAWTNNKNAPAIDTFKNELKSVTKNSDDAGKPFLEWLSQHVEELEQTLNGECIKGNIEKVREAVQLSFNKAIESLKGATETIKNALDPEKLKTVVEGFGKKAEQIEFRSTGKRALACAIIGGILAPSIAFLFQRHKPAAGSIDTTPAPR